ncbi:hypothetical protein A3F37_01145 [Candidatus Saccharibacteria bacterium RIFCSPHIGHO2_12_FULL_41_12]|nr:MAG: hypothetical protein A3F37_01145 [Candidatus Saccharibacteria bacterium RIFCSPHIGHO2_12_FULL_41_12]
MYKPYLVPISVKCIVFEDNRVWLRRNERNEWELPGGKLDEGEQPKETAQREALEEIGVEVATKNIIGAKLYTISKSSDEDRGVFVMAYHCKFIRRVGEVEHIGEAGPAEFQAFSIDEIDELNMPDFYKEWIINAR